MLLRLGLTTEAKEYRATYRQAQKTLTPGLPGNFDWRSSAYRLPRQRDQERFHGLPQTARPVHVARGARQVPQATG